MRTSLGRHGQRRGGLWRLGCAMMCALVAWLLPTRVHAQGGTGALRGTVRAAQTGVLLPYAVVVIPAARVERFSGANGEFVIVNLPAGSYDVTVRRLGFAPFATRVTITAGATSALDVTLNQLAVRLSSMTVRPVEPCATPGLPDPERFPEIAQLVGLLRENADRYRLLATEYPFAFLQVRAQGDLGAAAMIVRHIDSSRVVSTASSRYRAGRIIMSRAMGGGRSETVMAIPTLVDIADEEFINSHCFRYAGSSVQGGETWVQLDVRAADAIRSPDVHGSFYLDSATVQLRRMNLELSRPDRLPRDLREITAVQVTTTFLDIAPGLSIIDRICGVNWMKPGGKRPPPHAVELQQVLAYQFETAPPDVPRGREFPMPRWNPLGRVERSDLRCIDSPN